MKRMLLAVTMVLMISVGVMAQTLPTIPPAGYDDNRVGIPHGTITDVTYYSSVAGRDLVMKVYTPPAYNTNQSYPVIYCYQGIGAPIDFMFSNADWCVGVDVVCDNLVDEGIIQPFIIVALDDQFDGDYSNTNDMTIIDAIPYIDSHYSTVADADHRGLYGYSWGGGYCFNVGCANLNTFHHLSPSAAAPNKAGDDTLFPNGGAEAKQKLKTLFMSWGQYDYDVIKTSNWNCHLYCESNGIPHYWWEVAGSGHDTGVWRPAFWNFLQMMDEAMGGGSGGVSVPTNTWFRLSPRHATDKCLDVADAGTGNGTNVQLLTYADLESQQWQFEDVGGGYYRITPGHATGKCLDVSGISQDNGANIHIWDYLSGANQQWAFFDAGGGYYSIVARHSGRCVDVEGISTADGANVHQWDYLGGANQEWSFTEVGGGGGSVTNGTYKLIARHSGKAMDAYGAGTANGTQIIQWTYGGGTNQQWVVTDEGNGEYSLIGVQSGKAVDVENWGTANGTKVQLWDYFGGTEQKYIITATDSGYYRISPTHAPDSCLDVSGISLDDGANVQLWQWLSWNNQQWAFQAP